MNAKWLLKKIGSVIYENRSNIEYFAGNAAIVVGTGMIISKAEDAVNTKHRVEGMLEDIKTRDAANNWGKGEKRKACSKMVKEAAVGYGKAYGPGIAVEVAGLVLVGVSKATDRKEIASKSVALASLATQFYTYRERVRQDQGDEKDEEYLLGLTKEEQKQLVTDNDGGFKTTDLPPMPPHTFLFDETNVNWEKEGFMNRDFLESHLRWLNDRLWVEGVLFENDIRRDVGAPIDPDACEWGITAVDDEGNRQYISFGMEKNTERAKAFQAGTERSFWVTLNMEPMVNRKLYRLDKYRK